MSIIDFAKLIICLLMLKRLLAMCPRDNKKDNSEYYETELAVSSLLQKLLLTGITLRL